MAPKAVFDATDVGETTITATIAGLRTHRARLGGHVAFFELHEIDGDRRWSGFAYSRTYRKCAAALRARGPVRCRGRIVRNEDERGRQQPLFILASASPA